MTSIQMHTRPDFYHLARDALLMPHRGLALSRARRNGARTRQVFSTSLLELQVNSEFRLGDFDKTYFLNWPYVTLYNKQHRDKHVGSLRSPIYEPSFCVCSK